MTTGLAAIFSAIMIVGNVGACLTPNNFLFQRPMNFGGRFALNASTPSLKSSDWRSRL
jgi:hypothetical protein